MNRKVLMVGASLAMLVGLSACSTDSSATAQRLVVPKVQAETTTSSATPTTDAEHQQIITQLDRIESKIPTHTTTVTASPTTTTTTVTAPPTATVTETATATKTTTVTATPTSSTTAPPSSSTTTPPPPPPSGQTVGVGGVATPAGAISPPSGTGKWSITAAGVYDCKGAQVGWIEIKASNVTVQNCKVNAQSQYGIYSSGDNNVLQNNDIKGLKPTGDGDMNAFTFFGNGTKIQFNTAIDFVGTDPGDSHTDFIQTWVSSSHPTASSDVVIRSNKATGPANPKRLNSIPSIHQCVMVEDQGRGGNSGGSSSGMKNWLVVNNIFSDSWNQCIKNDGVDNFQVTKNDFQGSSSHVMEQASGSGLKYYSDNKVTGTYGNVGVPITSGAGPA
jgi:Predicted solute binding protein